MSTERIKQEAEALAEHIAQNPNAGPTDAFNKSLIGRTMQAFGAAPMQQRPEEMLVGMAAGMNRSAQNPQIPEGVDVDKAKLVEHFEINRDAMCARALPILEDKIDGVRKATNEASTAEQIRPVTIEAERLHATSLMFEENCGPAEQYRQRSATLSSPKSGM